MLYGGGKDLGGEKGQTILDIDKVNSLLNDGLVNVYPALHRTKDGSSIADPLQKERIIKALRKNGHVVGYMGDGVNDAPSLHNADVGICVNTATDIAKEASDIILLEKSLKVIFNGVIEGRKVYGNIIKYMKMALSSDFGDVFSIFIASIFLPFLPLLHKKLFLFELFDAIEFELILC